MYIEELVKYEFDYPIRKARAFLRGSLTTDGSTDWPMPNVGITLDVPTYAAAEGITFFPPGFVVSTNLTPISDAKKVRKNHFFDSAISWFNFAKSSARNLYGPGNDSLFKLPMKLIQHKHGGEIHDLESKKSPDSTKDTSQVKEKPSSISKPEEMPTKYYTVLIDMDKPSHVRVAKEKKDSQTAAKATTIEQPAQVNDTKKVSGKNSGSIKDTSKVNGVPTQTATKNFPNSDGPRMLMKPANVDNVKEKTKKSE